MWICLQLSRARGVHNGGVRAKLTYSTLRLDSKNSVNLQYTETRPKNSANLQYTKIRQKKTVLTYSTLSVDTKTVLTYSTLRLDYKNSVNLHNTEMRQQKDSMT